MRLTATRVLAPVVLLWVVLFAACGESATGIGDVILAPEPEVSAYQPALDDVRSRILPSSLSPVPTQRLDEALEELQLALNARRPQAAEAALERAQDALNRCDDLCLVAPERSVVEITLIRAGRLLSRGI